MDKFAMLKEAEVGGVLAAFMDAGYMEPVAADDFDYLTEKVAECLDDTYTVEDVAYAAAAVMDGGFDKTAEEVLFKEIAPAIGGAFMAKLAGDLDEDEFNEFVNDYLSDYF